MGSQLEFQVWAPSPLIWVSASWASGESRGSLSCVHSPGAERGGAPEATASVESSQLATECLYFLFLFEKFFLFKPPLVQTSTWLLTQLSPALSQESCSRPCTQAGASANLLPAQVPGTLLT